MLVEALFGSSAVHTGGEVCYRRLPCYFLNNLFKNEPIFPARRHAMLVRYYAMTLSFVLPPPLSDYPLSIPLYS